MESFYLCNAGGIDTISSGVSVAYAFHLAEKGVLTKEMVGFDLTWGNGKAVVKLMEQIIKKKGIGKLLAQGTLRMARALGRPEGEAAQVKGMEMPMHEGRAFQGLAVSYATGPRGACHLKGDYFNVDVGAGIPELGITSTGKRMNSANTGERAAKYQSIKDLYDTLALCKFAPLSVTLIARALTAVTGCPWDAAALLAAGDRSINLKRAVSNKLGLTRTDDKLPQICAEPLSEGATAGTAPDMDLLLKDYYQYRGWDWETGKPTKRKLEELGLGEAANDLYRS
jgi:aldehyde:ferredoxin oxidoreductase